MTLKLIITPTPKYFLPLLLAILAISIIPNLTSAEIVIPYAPEIQILNDNKVNSNLVKTINGDLNGALAGSSTQNPLDINQSTIPAGVTKLWQDNGGLKRSLKKGQKGEDVMILQLIIKSLTKNTDKNLVTKNFGPKTEAELRKAQSKLNIPVSGKLDPATRLAINNLMYDEACPKSIRKTLSNGEIESDFDKVFENLNRTKAIPLDYIPQDLVKLPSNIKTTGIECVSERVLNRIENMFSDAKKQGLDLAITSAYRSADIQKFLYSVWIQKEGNSAKAGIAEAGHSEHQLGTTIDISGKSIGYASVSNDFGKSKEGKWLANNSYKYGFIMSYPDKKQKETGYIYEPWHFRYVGIDNARDIFEEKMTIQEFLNI